MKPRRMLIGIVVGVAAGFAARLFAGGTPALDWVVTNLANPMGQIFIRLLFMLVVPLIFSALIVGIAGIELPRGRHVERQLAKLT